MDIQLSSNFERLLFEAAGRDAERIRTMMNGFAESGSFALERDELADIAGIFAAARVDEAETAATIAALDRKCQYLADPHTAVGLAATAKLNDNPSVPMIVLSTAHPAKFPDAIKAATGRTPGTPPRLEAALAGREEFATIAADAAAVRSLIAAQSSLTPATAS
jgi:threonine synthase